MHACYYSCYAHNMQAIYIAGDTCQMTHIGHNHVIWSNEHHNSMSYIYMYSVKPFSFTFVECFLLIFINQYGKDDVDKSLMHKYYLVLFLATLICLSLYSCPGMQQSSLWNMQCTSVHVQSMLDR